MIGTCAEDYLPEEYANEIKTMDQEVLNKDSTIEREGIAYSPDGTEIWRHIIKFPLKEAGEEKMVGTISLDLTKRKTAELALQESNRKFRNIFENSLVGIYQTSLEGRFISVNIAFAKTLGYDSPEEIMTCITNIGEQLYANSVDRNNLAQLLKEHGKVENFEIQMNQKNGQPIWLLSSPRVVRDEKGNVLFYEGAAIDITERKRADEALDKKMKELMTFQRLTVGRELKMIALKKEINTLLDQAGKPPKYKIRERN